jgi:hypothetical protein
MTGPRGLAAALAWVGAIGIAAVAVMRCLVFFAPQVVFDVDPLYEAGALGAMGPAGSLWLDVVLLAAAAALLLGCAIAGGRIDGLLVLLALLPLPVVLFHGATDLGDLWRGSTWAAAALAAVAVAHLEPGRLRRTTIVLLVAVLAPLIARGVSNVTIEHAGTVAAFEENKEAFLEDRGWEPGSPAALIFERRLRHRQPAAWSVTTNIYASYMAFGVVFLLGVVLAAARGRHALIAVGAGLGLAAAAGALWMTGALGAVGATALATVLLVAPLAFRASPRVCAGLALGAVALVLLGIVVRGAVLPEGFASERSLLFRWHYLASSASIVGDAPVVGVGPDGFQAAYVKHRLPRNPEEVTSAHSVFVDWVADLGVLGVAWIALALVLAWRAGAALARGDGDGEPPDDALPREMYIPALVLTALAVAPAIAVEAHALAGVGSLVRLVGLLAFLLAALLLGPVFTTLGPAGLRAALAAGALAVVLHGQIEMTHTRPGAVAWAWCVLGLAGGTRGGGAGGARIGSAAAALALLAAGWIAITGAIPAARQQRLMVDASRVLFAHGPPGTPVEEAMRRRAAVDLLLAADAALPTATAPRLAAADQLLRAARLESRLAGDALLRLALATLEPLRARGDARAESEAAAILRTRFTVLGDETARDEAVAAAARLVERDPHGLQARRRLADTLWETGARAGARVEYEQVLRIDADFELDPLKQLPEGDRRMIEQRLAEGGSP